MAPTSDEHLMMFLLRLLLILFLLDGSWTAPDSDSENDVTHLLEDELVLSVVEGVSPSCE